MPDVAVLDDTARGQSPCLASAVATDQMYKKPHGKTPGRITTAAFSPFFPFRADFTCFSSQSMLCCQTARGF